ncbi:MAG: integration host factor subunit beta [Desulfobacteraceae bacterium]|nr:integration host factor subunit beta [Desulfobacteraceae bacterium]
MNKLELISALKERSKLSKTEANEVVNIFFNSLRDSFIRGERVEIRGLCSFFIKEYKGYVGRNPKTGEQVEIAQKKLPFFKCGKELRDRVDY